MEIESLSSRLFELLNSGLFEGHHVTISDMIHSAGKKFYANLYKSTPDPSIGSAMGISALK